MSSFMRQDEFYEVHPNCSCTEQVCIGGGGAKKALATMSSFSFASGRMSVWSAPRTARAQSGSYALMEEERRRA